MTEETNTAVADEAATETVESTVETKDTAPTTSPQLEAAREALSKTLNDIHDGTEGDKVEDRVSPTKETEIVKEKEDDAEETPEKTPEKDDAKPVELTDRQKRGAKYTDLTPEQLAKADKATLKLLDELGGIYDRGVGKVGKDIQTARKTAGLPKPEAKPESEEEEVAGEKGDEPSGKEDKPKDDSPVTFTEKDFQDDDGIFSESKVAQAFGKLQESARADREENLVLRSKLSEVNDTLELLVSDHFFASLDKEAFAHLGEGPTHSLAADSPERAARMELVELARQCALGVAVGEGKPISFLEAMQRVVGAAGIENIRKAERDKNHKAAKKSQAGALHEPGRSTRAKTGTLEEARQKLADVLGSIH